MDGLRLSRYMIRAPRFLFRETPKMYAYDHLAQPLSTHFWEDSSYKQLNAKQQMLAFLPWHHAENLEFQKRAFSIFNELAEADKSLE